MQSAFVQRFVGRPVGPDPYGPVRWGNGAPAAFQSNPRLAPYAHYANPMHTATKIVLGLLGIAAVGGGVYYFATRASRTTPPPLRPAVPGSLGAFGAQQIVDMPDPVIFVLRPGESFDIDFGSLNVIGRFIEDYDAAPNTDELIATALDGQGKVADPFTAQILRIGTPPTWGADSAAAIKISPRGILEAATAKQVWVMGANAAVA